jgi:uracil-DNA glycosylase family 4
MNRRINPLSLKGNKSCDNCDLHRNATHVCIMGQGSLMADIMVVLDSPGFGEDKKGKALEGKMEKFVHSLLHEAGINPDDVYITNSVKCRPPEKKTIKASELKACSEYLELEFKRVKPKYVLAMGSTSMKAVLGTGHGKITDAHGQVVEKDGMQVMPVFAPGVAFRDPKKLEPLKEDIKRFGQLSKGKQIGKPKLNFQVVKNFDNFNQMIEEIEKAKIASYDIETTSLNRFGGKITMIGIGLRKKQWILPLEIEGGPFYQKDREQKMMMEILKEAMDKKVKKKTGKIGKKTIVTQNGKFDNLWLRTHFKVRFDNTFDTMIAAYCLDENSPNGLKYLVRTIFGVTYDVDLDTKTGKGSLDKLYEYLAYDVYYTLELYYELKKRLKMDPPTYFLFKKLMMPVFHAYENVQMEGVWIRQEQFKEVEKTLNDRVAEIDAELAKIAKKEKLDIKNWGSAQQLGDVLFNQLKLPILDKTATGNPSTGESVLMRLRDKHPVINLILERKGVKQQLSFFINGWKKRMEGNRLYPNFHIHTTVTGRTSSNDPNLQQVPRDKKIRSLIGAPPGWTLVEIDYSQAELRVVAHVSNDPRMLHIFRTAEIDIHSNTATKLNGLPPEKQDKESRKKAKAVNFGFVYGMGHFKFKDYARDNYGVTLTEREAMEWRKRFFEEYNYLPDWHEKQRRLARSFKQVRNLIGRLRRLPEIDSPDKGMVAEAERQAINSPIQSFASDLMLMSVIEVDSKIPKSRCRIIGTVHDAGLYIIKNEHINDIVPQIKKIMEKPELLKTFGVNIKVPIVADVSVGDWGNGKDWQEGDVIMIGENGSVDIIKEDDLPF